MIFDYESGRVGCINAGMDRPLVRSILGECDEFRKSSSDTNTTDNFSKHGVHVFYDDDDLVIGVEVHRWAEFLYREVLLIGMTEGEIESVMNRLGEDCDFSNSAGITLENGAVGLFLMENESGEDVVVSVYVDLSVS